MSDYSDWEMNVANAARTLAGDPDPTVDWRRFAYLAMRQLAGSTPVRVIGACDWRQQGINQTAQLAVQLYGESLRR